MSKSSAFILKQNVATRDAGMPGFLAAVKAKMAAKP
jgi:hypothetical protein